MNFDVAVNGRPWKIAIEPLDQSREFTVVVKGKARVVDAAWIDAATLSLIDGTASREVRLHRGDAGMFGVTVDGRLFEVVVAKRDRKNPSDASSLRASSAAIKAPMPGRITRVLVAVGDHVVAQQPLVVVEAMKMENELCAPRAGVIKEVNVTVGTAVEAGAILVVVE